MIAQSHHRLFGPVMWGTAGATFVVLAVVAVEGVDPRIAGYAAGVLVLVCLSLCAAAYWLDARAARATTRLLER